MKKSLCRFTGVQDRPRKMFNCPGCGKFLQYNTGVWENGMPSAWAFCAPEPDKRGRKGCKRVWCPRMHNMTTAKDYDLGYTDASLRRAEEAGCSPELVNVPICMDPECAADRKRFATFLRKCAEYGRSTEVRLEAEEFEKRSKIGPANWQRQQEAQMVLVWRYFAQYVPGYDFAEREKTRLAVEEQERLRVEQEALAAAQPDAPTSVKTSALEEMDVDALLADVEAEASVPEKAAPTPAAPGVDVLADLDTWLAADATEVDWAAQGAAVLGGAS